MTRKPTPEELAAALERLGAPGIQAAAAMVRSHGQGTDRYLAHLNAREMRLLDRSTEGGGDRNPVTGLPRFLEGETGGVGDTGGGDTSGNTGGGNTGGGNTGGGHSTAGSENAANGENNATTEGRDASYGGGWGGSDPAGGGVEATYGPVEDMGFVGSVSRTPDTIDFSPDGWATIAGVNYGSALNTHTGLRDDVFGVNPARTAETLAGLVGGPIAGLAARGVTTVAGVRDDWSTLDQLGAQPAAPTQGPDQNPGGAGLPMAAGAAPAAAPAPAAGSPVGPAAFRPTGDYATDYRNLMAGRMAGWSL